MTATKSKRLGPITLWMKMRGPSGGRFSLRCRIDPNHESSPATSTFEEATTWLAANALAAHHAVVYKDDPEAARELFEEARNWADTCIRKVDGLEHVEDRSRQAAANTHGGTEGTPDQNG